MTFEMIIAGPKDSINKITDAENVLYYLFLALVVLSCFLFSGGKVKPAQWILVIASFCFHLFLHLVSDQILPWDEQYHLLVSKNLMDNPLRPVLYQYSLDAGKRFHWELGNIWLHKPPLFMWLIAVSMKIFGATLFAARIPSLLMLVFLPLLVYRSAEIVFKSARPAFLAALFSCCPYFISLLAVGGYATDHNDVAFLFFVTTSLYAWLEYSISTKKNVYWWLLLIGISAGFAILTKLFAGFMVFGGWAFSILLNETKAI